MLLRRFWPPSFVGIIAGCNGFVISWVGELLLMVFQDVAFLSSQVSFTPYFLKVVV